MADSRQEFRPGSEEDFERLYRLAYNRVLVTLVGVLGDLAAAEDCLQDAFESAYRGWPKWRGDAPAEAWLHRIAINEAISYQRYSRLREVGKVIARIGRPVPPPDPGTIAERHDLFDALRKLPARQAAAIVLRYHHGYTNREIATALGIPEPTVASRLVAARARLRLVLGDDHLRRGHVEMVTLAEDRVPSD